MTNLTEVPTNNHLQALKDFATSERRVLVDQLEEILDDVAKTGQYIFPWHFMKPLYAFKLDKVTEEFLQAVPPLKEDGSNDEAEIQKLSEFRNELLSMFDKFISAPFTIQRVSELLTNPKKHYKTSAKFFRALEKNILVVSTVDHVPADQRPILKRSHVEEIAESDQNGFSECELKPPVKKSAAEVELNLQENAENPSNNSKTSENCKNMPLAIDEAISNEELSNPNSNDGLEKMLLCTERVNDESLNGSPQVKVNCGDQSATSEKKVENSDMKESSTVETSDTGSEDMKAKEETPKDEAMEQD